MAESLAIRIKNSFSFNKSVITKQDCECYLINKFINKLESGTKNSNGNYKINKKLTAVVNQYCSITKNELEAIFNGKFILIYDLRQVEEKNLEKFKSLLTNCLKCVKNKIEPQNLVSDAYKNIEELIALKSGWVDLIYKNKNVNAQHIGKSGGNNSLNVERKNKIITIAPYQEEEEGLTAQELNRIFEYLEENRPLEEFKSKESDYFIKAYQEIKENSEKKNKQLSVDNQTDKLILSETTKLKTVLAVDTGSKQNIASIDLKQNNEINNNKAKIKETASLNFWQILSQKTTQLLATSWSFIKNKLIGFLFPTFFSTKIN
ncbi:hypothetical protein QE177_11465 [Arsenophonus sp. aPb]|uniref:hypothetical protein n=1 Tax=Arsenophonus sp. aPb TaxID=3041619 RepID=UPI0024687E17|nr:hypothetical protein [Arsenophonus sp. aPb]WGL97809.1 hypothetical protein QE177_11465 [Arsenophonus sp. aPb]